MRNSSACRFFVVALGLSAATAAGSPKNVVTITSMPSGATVKLNDVVVGTTPYQVTYPGGYFHDTKTVLGKRLLNPIKVKITQDGYIEVERELTRGPQIWRNVYGINFGNYWLLTANNFHFDLQPVTSPTASSNPVQAEPQIAEITSNKASMPECAKSSQNGELTLENEKKVAFIRLSSDKDDVGGAADRVYASRSSCRPNMRYGEDLAESWETHPERRSKFVFEDVVKIEFLPFTKDEKDQISKGQACVDVGCPDRRATVTFRDGTKKENIVIHLSDSPYYAITADNRAYNLTDYDIQAVIIERK